MTPITDNDRTLFYIQTNCGGNTFEVDNYGGQPGQHNSAIAPHQVNDCRMFQLVRGGEEGYYKIFKPKCGPLSAMHTFGGNSLGFA